MVKDVAGQSLPTCPGKGPEWRRQASFLEFLLCLVPEVQGLVGKMKLDFRDVRWRLQDRVCQNEFAGTSLLCHRRQMLLGSRPPMRQTSFHSSSGTGCTERRK